MSLKQGNLYFEQGNYQKAIDEYRKVSSDSLLYKSAQFNIKLCEQNIGSPIQQRNQVITGNSNQPLVSVIMPVFNVANYLDTAILSVLNQSYKNIELIIVNDASTDHSLNIIKMYEKQDSRVKVIDLEFNTLGGAGIPSNVGVDAAQGKYIAYADSDDILDQHAIEKMVDLAERTNTEIVIADFITFDDKSREKKISYDKGNWNDIPLNKVFHPKDTPSVFRISPVPWRKLYLRSFINKNNIRFPEGDYFYEDNPLHWFVLTKASKVIMLDYVVAQHRMEREGQTMGAMNFKLSALFSHLNTIKNFLFKDSFVPENFKKELIDFSYRSNWVIDRQEQDKIKKVIQKRYAQVSMDIEKEANLSKNTVEKIRSNFYKRCTEYNKHYPDLDLSIVIPVYNCVDLLPKLVDELLKINLKTEIFLVDDGSTDGSTELCDSYAKNNERVYSFFQNNKGAGVARNLVIPLLTGKYSYFVDADDIVDIKALEEAIKFADKNKNDLLMFTYKINFFEKNTTRGMWNADQDLWNKLLKSSSNQEKKILSSQMVNYPWIRIIKTSLLHNENIFFGKTVVHNDVPYHWHTIIAAKNIGVFDKAICTHRKFDVRQQITNISDERRLMVLEAYRYTHNLLKKYDDYPVLFNYWQKFTRDLLTWARDRVPKEKLEFYKKRHKQIVDGLKEVKI
ncbi:Hyaluronan synthase [Phocoenobacter uteri]|uniref:Hyaluronan synthase n=1 Tax=Phocoenobacter uteri TaxID=146806 RepID=A0A379CAY0_9PAST|nr:glycosyltransferase family 2 protein [Phocoenobacter uteri]MDG6881295.1 hypothetical protein [Phocoenobacter uteri]SUB59319.1 Hyaluronan synthase [Phocoenobacter uteri]